MASDCGSNCSTDGTLFSYEPSRGGNAFFLAAFAALVPVTFLLGLRFRSPLFAATLITGLLLEVVGFLGRFLLSKDLSDQTYSILALVGTVLGPTLISASLFVVLPHSLSIYGERASPVAPVVASCLACSLIVAAAILQLVGIVYMVFEYKGLNHEQSAGVIAGGLGIQAACHIFSIVLHIWLHVGRRSLSRATDPKHSNIYQSARFKRFLTAAEMSTAILLAYSIYRVIEMALGRDGALFQSEPAFMVMCGALPLISALLLTAFHPGAAFGPAWSTTSPRRMRRHAPPPLRQTYGYQPHHRYNPSIRSQGTPTSPGQMRLSKPPETPAGSPGLPQNPKPTHKPPSPRTPPLPMQTSTIDKRLSEQSGVVPQSRPRKMVDSEALW